jgi:hypothetical protein
MTAKIARKTYPIEKDIFLFTGMAIPSSRCHERSRMLKKFASRGRTVGTDPVRIKTTSAERKTTRIVHAPADTRNCTGHPVALSDWNCKEETLTLNPQTWRFLQLNRTFRAKSDG